MRLRRGARSAVKPGAEFYVCDVETGAGDLRQDKRDVVGDGGGKLVFGETAEMRFALGLLTGHQVLVVQCTRNEFDRAAGHRG